MITKNRNQTIDMLRGIAALCMILGHSFIVYPIDISNVPWCSTFRYVIYTFHMELFFILAGWVYKCTSYLSFIKKKATRLLIPYFLFGFFSQVLHILGGSLVNGNRSLAEGIYTLLFRGGDYWFLPTLFIICAVYPLFDYLVKGWKAKIVALAIILLLYNIIDWPQTLLLRTSMKYFPYFILGDLIGKSGITEHEHTASQKALLGFGGIAVYIAIYVLCTLGIIQLGHFGVLLRAVSFCTMLYALCKYAIFLPCRIKHAVQSLLGDCSKFSLQLYLFNGYILVPIRTIMCSILHIESPLLLVSGIWIGNIVITLLVCKVILPKSKLLSFLCGL